VISFPLEHIVTHIPRLSWVEYTCRFSIYFDFNFFMGRVKNTPDLFHRYEEIIGAY